VVIDATAGWCEDAWLMAGLGCHVLAVERNRIIHTLARDGLLRTGAHRADVLGRINLVQADARHLLRRLAYMRQGRGEPGDELPPAMQDFLHPDVVFIDPMFPSGRKTAERKPMRLLRRLVGDDGDAAEILEWALRVARRRVVVKRPIKAPPLGGKPTTTHKEKSLRYDVYVPGVAS
jgi:16S rRNA (guanine1516-N2)-methyltransferase